MTETLINLAKELSKPETIMILMVKGKDVIVFKKPNTTDKELSELLTNAKLDDVANNPSLPVDVVFVLDKIENKPRHRVYYQKSGMKDLVFLVGRLSTIDTKKKIVYEISW